MNPFMKISIKFLKSSKILTLACYISIVITVILMISMNNFSHYIKNGYKQRLIEQYGDFDLYITGSGQEVLSEENISYIKEKDYTKQISYGIYQYISLDDKSVYAVGIYDNEIMKSRYHYTNKLKKGDIILTDILAEALNVKIGDVIQYNSKTYKIVDIIIDQTQSADKIYMALFDVYDLQTLTARDDKYDFITIKISEGYANDSVIKEIKNKFENIEVNILDEDEYYQKSIKTVSAFITFISFLVLIIGSLLISSVFLRYLQKSNENIKIIRCIGGSPQNVSTIMKYQSLIINGSACLSGFIISFIFNKNIIEWLSKSSQWKNADVKFQYSLSIAIMIGVFLIVQVVMMLFVKRLIKKLPSQNECIVDIKKTKRIFGFKLITVLISCSIYLYILILALKGESVFVPMTFSLVILFLPIGMLLSYIIQAFLYGVTIFARKLRLNNILIAIQQLIPHIKENIFIILAITSIVVFTLVGNNFQRILTLNSINYYKSSYLTDIKVIPQDFMSYEESSKLVSEYKQSNIESIYFYQLMPATLLIDNQYKNCSYYLTSFQSLQNAGIITKSTNTNEVIISNEFAKQNNLHIKDILKLPIGYMFVNNADADLKLANAKEYMIGDIVDTLKYEILIDSSNEEFIIKDRTYLDCIFLLGDNETLEEITKQLSLKYNIKWSNLNEVLNYCKVVSNDEWKILKVCLSALFMIIGLGLINSLNNIIRSRTTEYKILQRLGATRLRILRILIIQVFTYLSLGIVFGCFIGVFFLYSINFAETNSWILSISFDEITMSIVFLFLLSLGTLPEIYRIIYRKYKS